MTRHIIFIAVTDLPRLVLAVQRVSILHALLLALGPWKPY